jgi:hypothetical protein
MIELVQRLARALPGAGPPLGLDAVLGQLPAPLPLDPKIEPRDVQRLEIPIEAGIKVPAFLLRPEAEERGVLVALDDRGKEALASEPLIRAALEDHWAVCGVDPRGLGELGTTDRGWVAAVSLLLGENFIWREAWDLRRSMAYLAAAPPLAGKPFALYARGDNATLAATYTLAQESRAGKSLLRCFVLRDGFLSFREFLDRPGSLPISYRLLSEDRDRTTAFDREIPFEYFVFDALRSFDLPELLASTAAIGLVVNPIDGDWNPLPEAAARHILPRKVRLNCDAAPEKTILDFLRSAR